MKCSKCGREIKNFYKVDFDGMTRVISLCEECIKEILTKESQELQKEGVKLLAAHSRYVQDSFLDSSFSPVRGSSEIFIKTPILMIELLFGEFDEREKMNEMVKRELFILERELKSAVIREDYKKANEIKKKIKEIKKKMDVWEDR
ncbi:MAG: hypothetical protein DRP38_07570 [Thermotogae bacterium]|nr:MAG: hypothetical protein DRP38_07570 [Thermotogota bacterium]